MSKKAENRWILIKNKLEDIDVTYKNIEDNKQEQLDWQKQVYAYLIEEYVSLLAMIKEAEAKDDSSTSES